MKLPVSEECRRSTHFALPSQAGFAYMEILVATLIMAVALVPMIDALQSGLQGSGVYAEQVAIHYNLAGKMEEVLAKSFDDLDAEAVAVADPTVATSFSDTAGQQDRRLVYLARYDGDDADGDGDPFTGGDDGLLWVRVAVENTHHVMETLTVR